MAKAVFRPNEITLLDKKVALEPPPAFLPLYAASGEELEEIDEVPEYDGPSIEELQREAEEFRAQWESEREAMIRSAKAEADGIVKAAEEAAFQEVKRKTDQAQILRREAEDEAERILAEARQKAADIELASKTSFEHERQDAEERGRLAGREVGYKEGIAEVERLVERTQTILERAQDKRAEILAETEQQVIDLVLLISRKVIKVISENQRAVVISNVVQALRKVKDRGNIVIKVNMADLKLSTEHIKDFIKMVEGVKNIQILEDSTVDQGGCVVETDFGEIDARISSQLTELENRILELSPIKGRSKGSQTEGSL